MALLEDLEQLVARADMALDNIKDQVFAPTGKKQFTKTYKISEAADLIYRHKSGIRKAENDGFIESGREGESKYRGFSLDQLNAAREYFGSQPRLGSNDTAEVIAVQNFKGGVAKTTISVHLAQWLAIRGFRVLIIDLDSQASTTTMFGYTPDIEIEEADTIAPYIYGDQRTIHYAIRDTHIPNLSLIPSNLQLYQAEYYIQAESERTPVYSYLPAALEDVMNDFEVIIIDPPPALGMFSMNALVAATSMLVPMPPRMLDFASTMQFFNMFQETITQIQQQLDFELDYNFIKIVLSKKKQRLRDEKYARAEDDIVEIARAVLGDRWMLDKAIYESSAIDNAVNQFSTLYEMNVSNKSHRLAIEAMDYIFEEVMDEIIKTRPAMQKALKRQPKKIAA
jgi:chromosome partitioning protein